MPGGPTSTGTEADRIVVAESTEKLIDLCDGDEQRYPAIHRVAGGVGEDRFEAESESGLAHLLEQIEGYFAASTHPRSVGYWPTLPAGTRWLTL